MRSRRHASSSARAFRFLATAALLVGCASKPPPQPPPSSDPALIAALRGTRPLNAISVTEDPYRTWAGRTPVPPPRWTVCGVHLETDRVHYRLESFASEAEARQRGFAVTHLGACGACSTSQDLAVYLERPDLTAPVRRCGMMTSTANLECLAALGFSEACARIWFFNTQNTRRECFAVCVRAWASDEPSTHADGTLNDCLQCDEDRSGPVFKAVAGRTRRNSGIPSSIQRPDDEMAHVVHDYVPH
jgi:hypothetical protein